MTLYRRGRNYSISIWVDGVRHLKSTGTTNRREAATIERDFREELNRRRHQVREASPDMTFTDLAARFLADGSPRPLPSRPTKSALAPFWRVPHWQHLEAFGARVPRRTAQGETIDRNDSQP